MIFVLVAHFPEVEELISFEIHLVELIFFLSICLILGKVVLMISMSSIIFEAQRREVEGAGSGE